MYVPFAVNAWAAIAPGIFSNHQWQEWAISPWLPEGQVASALQAVPAMARRRLSRLGRMAVTVVDDVSSGAEQAGLPVVWASRYGDAQRSLDMLREHVLVQPLSPTAFALSVHNGIGAQYSIARKINMNALSIAAGANTAEAGMVEAASLLADGYPEAVVVCYDAPLPDSYARFHDHPVAEFAWALRISREPLNSQSRCFSLKAEASSDLRVLPGPSLPPGLDVLRFMLSDETQLHRPHQRGAWRWNRDHG